MKSPIPSSHYCPDYNTNESFIEQCNYGSYISNYGFTMDYMKKEDYKPSDYCVAIFKVKRLKPVKE